MMKRLKQNDSFWTSYADLMTSLFFVMLVLFTIFAIYSNNLRNLNNAQKEENDILKDKIGKLMVTQEQYENILKLEDQFKILSNSTSLIYNSHKKIFFAKDIQEREIFYSQQSNIKPEYLELVDKVGTDIFNVLKSLNDNQQFCYQLVIEGYAAIHWRNLIDNTFDPDDISMYYLSYSRALALYNRWREIGLDFRQYNTEVILAGSGYNGINRDRIIEEYNKRFVVQIIPKVNRINND